MNGTEEGHQKRIQALEQENARLRHELVQLTACKDRVNFAAIEKS